MWRSKTPVADHRWIEVVDRVRRCHDEKLALVAMRLEQSERLVDGASGLLVGCPVPPLGDRIELVEEEQARQVPKGRLKRLVDVLRRLPLDAADQVAGRDVH
jgi:hypothetical protein